MNIKSAKSGLTMRQAIAHVRSEANALIEQMERKARGWDTGRWRDDMPHADRHATNTIRVTNLVRVTYAFGLSEEFTGRTAQYDADAAVMDAANNL